MDHLNENIVIVYVKDEGVMFDYGGEMCGKVFMTCRQRDVKADVTVQRPV